MLVLRTLDSLGPMHGYGIAQHIQRLSASVLQVEEGSLYPALQRMLIKGWVKAEWGLSENNRRAKFYELTKSGHVQFEVERDAGVKLTAAMAQVLGTAQEIPAC